MPSSCILITLTYWVFKIAVRLKAFFCRQGLARLRRQERLVLNVSNHQPRQDCWSLFSALLHLYRMACVHQYHRLNPSLALAICTSSLPLNSKRNPALSSACVFLRAIGKKWFCFSPNHKICQICGPLWWIWNKAKHEFMRCSQPEKNLWSKSHVSSHHLESVQEAVDTWARDLWLDCGC